MRERIRVDVLPAHKRALHRLAAAEDVSEAAMVRLLIRAEAERRGLWIDEPEPAGEGEGEGEGEGRAYSPASS